MTRPTAASADVRRGRVWTWIALVMTSVGVAVGSSLDPDAHPAVPGFFAAAAALQMMLAGYWWRSRYRR
ncbi:hypothetical protein [Blastococcus haudaquaticus]|uniref:Uncharacterized protein n=1 Tax=Blastococcus haudaquaticus TaxID=1938745 RepID=A0A286H5T9_9ACTN|nr:hypothetical protein [Blastococcus haudaquaticus]SOE03147.1 hypothetical protein SAMN06272739_4003 [Blastococcus haudaquaticus]